ncbi:MAG: DUF4912 domain-containing protein, partial [Planctomycetales bacterium]
MTAEKLQTYTRENLAQMAKKKGMQGWHSMRKDQLVKALAQPKKTRKKSAPVSKKSAASSKKSAPVSKKSAAPSRKTSAKKKSPVTSKRRGAAAPVKNTRTGSVSPSSKKKSTAAKRPASEKPRASKRPVTAKTNSQSPAAKRKAKKVSQAVGRAKEQLQRSKNLAFSSPDKPTDGKIKDRLELHVCDPYWLQASWELSRSGVRRVEAALGQDWHAAKPVLRLYEITEQGVRPSDNLLRTISIHGGVRNWFIDVLDPPKSYRAEIGYLTAAGKFFMLARSNAALTPRAGASQMTADNWENGEDGRLPTSASDMQGSTREFLRQFNERDEETTKHVFPLNINGQRKRDFKFNLDA